MILSPHSDGGGWSYRPEGETRALKETLLLLSSAACGDGNMLLNIAPLPDGSIREEEVDILRGVAPWMKQYGEAIYNTRGGPWRNGEWGGATHRGNVVYVHVYEWPHGGDTLKLKPLNETITKAETLTGGSVAFTQNDNGVDFTLAKNHQQSPITLIKLTLDCPVTVIQDVSAIRTE